MLKKIIAVKNLGRFHNSTAPANPALTKLTLVVGANGYGKTTLCAVLRSLQTGNPSHIIGRKTLGSSEPPTIELLLDTGAVRFDGTSWSKSHPAVAIFDDAFVAENVHSGASVDIDHKRNLYRVIIGNDGVKLAETDAALAAESRAKTSEITASERTLAPHVPVTMTLDAFIALPAGAKIDEQITAQEAVVGAAKEASAIRQRDALSEFSIPALPEGLSDLLARTVDDVSKDAEKLLADHLAAHGMDEGGGNWVSDGLQHAADTCPFCGQVIRGLPIIAAFRAVFGDRYRSLRSDVATMTSDVDRLFGDAALGRIDVIAAQNRAAVEFWKKYCAFKPEPSALHPDVIGAIKGLGSATFDLLRHKANAPLEPVALSPEFSSAFSVYSAATATATAVNEEIRVANTLIAAKKTEVGAVDSKAAEASLERLKAVRTRHTVAVAKLCTAHAGLLAEKVAIDARKEATRAKLDRHTKGVVQPYEKRINDLLDAFNAGFRFAEVKHGYPGGVATSSYRLVINNVAVDVGDTKTPVDRPSFKNTLSAGDRATLALALFLAREGRDPAIRSKIVVFDDPFASQDSFRRRQTIYEIIKIAEKCAQVIVLSHDATFLKQIWDKIPPSDRVALAIASHQIHGSKIGPIDLEKACQGRTATDIDDLQAFLSTGAGKLIDIIRKIRAVLETYCRTTYPSLFLSTDWLGDIVGKIRSGGDQHPARHLYEELDQINDYTKQYHHGEDLTDATPDQIDPTELSGFTKKTLRIVNALQA